MTASWMPTTRGVRTHERSRSHTVAHIPSHIVFESQHEVMLLGRRWSSALDVKESPIRLYRGQQTESTLGLIQEMGTLSSSRQAPFPETNSTLIQLSPTLRKQASTLSTILDPILLMRQDTLTKMNCAKCLFGNVP